MEAGVPEEACTASPDAEKPLRACVQQVVFVFYLVAHGDYRG